MNAKKKLIVVLTAFALVVVSTIVAVTAVLAAQSVSVSSNINITYNASENVYSTITLEYKTEKGSRTSLGSVSFDGTGASGSMPDFGNIALSSDNGYVDIFVTINNPENSYLELSIGYTDTENDDKNMNYYVDSSPVPKSSSQVNFVDNGEIGQGEVSFTLRLAIANKNANAICSGSFNIHLNYRGQI